MHTRKRGLIPMGAIELTEEAQQLVRICERTYTYDIFEDYLERWRNAQGVSVILE